MGSALGQLTAGGLLDADGVLAESGRLARQQVEDNPGRLADQT